ncbi:hypothetical protein YP76_26060 [Sphingobium chungbukense]|uniref:Uncharacterized protein n=1 Tax=Sphingobium chungbukense TaxID=56193 RepID=A0A0M3AGW5_9SPHN|nr:hypothetical protein YP76_26060 [Sphingobium chungbukense]
MLSVEAQCLNESNQTNSVPAEMAHHGVPGGRIALVIRGGRRPRAGGAKPQEAVLFFTPQAYTFRIRVIHKREVSLSR